MLWATIFFASMLAICVLALLFQTYIRYRYEEIGGALWRVDEFTSQRCVVAAPYTPCLLPNSTSLSTSTSSSSSVSPSTSVKSRSPAPHRSAVP